MNNLLQVKRIVQAKWNKSTGSDSNHSQEELTQEAEKILKKAQSKSQHVFTAGPTIKGHKTGFYGVLVARIKFHDNLLMPLL